MGYAIAEETALTWIVNLWVEKLKRAHEHKRVLFQDDADVAMRFYRGPHDFVYGEYLGPGMPRPSFLMTVNRVADIVARFGPVLYHADPDRKVSPRKPVPIPPGAFPNPLVFNQIQQQEGARAMLDGVKSRVMEAYLNWTPTLTDLRGQARKAIDEALIKGRGCLWPAVWKPPGANYRVVGSFFDSVDNLLIDPDAESLKDATWIARRCIHPVWQVEREFGIRPGSLKGQYESVAQQTYVEQYKLDGYDRSQGTTNDLIVYWKIYSKLGIGSRLYGSGTPDWNPLDVFGDNIFMVVAEGVPYPLNLPPEVLRMPGADGTNPAVVNDIIARVQWPIPTWVNGSWPVALLDFRPVPRQVWPMSHVKPGLGELRALDWLFSFLVGRIRNTSRDIIAVMKDAAEEIKTTILQGADQTLVELDGRFKDIREAVQVLQFPPVQGDVIKLIELLTKQFEDRVGLNELGGGGTQIRSATEADARQSIMNIRSDDMAESVEAFMTQASLLEAFAIRLYLQPPDIQPILGDAAAMFFGQFLATRNASQIAAELEYRIEEGSVRKPNRERDIANMNLAMQTMFAPYFQFAMQTGNPGPFNELVTRWCKARGEDPTGLTLPVPPPPMPGPPRGPAPGAPPGPSPGPGSPSLPHPAISSHHRP